MAEYDNLLQSVANTIATYKAGEIAVPTPAHVHRWVSQFGQQLPFLREFDHVLKASFYTEQRIRNFLHTLAHDAGVAGPNPAAYWASAHFLRVQKNGGSQRDMLRLFGETLYQQFGIDLNACGQPGGDYIYLDDAVFSGSRVSNDLEPWIRQAPATARVRVIVGVLHHGGFFQSQQNLNAIIKSLGKNITLEFWRETELESRKYYRNTSQVLWPAVIPNTPEVTAYMAKPTKFPFDQRIVVAPHQSPFSSEAGRQVLEEEFFIAGAKIIDGIGNPKPVIRPLGFSFFGIGFGAMTVTYRNCPNNCPLAMWWGDPEATSGALCWYPLLPRDTYSTPVSVFHELTDF